MTLRREVVLFALGGVLGFVIDASVVQVLVRMLEWNPYVARVPSFLLAASATWLWNRSLTFRHRRSEVAQYEWLRWLAVMSVGAVVNYGTYAALVAGFPGVRASPWLGVAAGSAAAALINFYAARTVVFRGRKKPS